MTGNLGDIIELENRSYFNQFRENETNKINEKIILLEEILEDLANYDDLDEEIINIIEEKREVEVMNLARLLSDRQVIF